MKVDIVIPYYGAENFLCDTVSSLLEQSKAALGQIIIVDDGSKIPAKSVLSQKTLANSQIQIIRCERNFGESHAVNLGWRLGKSRFIAIISADDPQLPDWIQKMMDFIARNSGYVFYYPNRKVIDVKGDFLRSETLRNFRRNDLLKSLVCVPSVGTIIDTFMLPKNFVPRNESVRYPSDFVQYLNLLRYGDGKRVPNAWGVWREHNESQSVKTSQNDKLNLFSQTIVNWAEENSDMMNVNEARLVCGIHAFRYMKSQSLYARLKSLRDLFMKNEYSNFNTVKTVGEVCFTFTRGKLNNLFQSNVS